MIAVFFFLEKKSRENTWNLNLFGPGLKHAHTHARSKRDTDSCTSKTKMIHVDLKPWFAILKEMYAKMITTNMAPPIRAACPMLVLHIHDTINRLFLMERFDRSMPEICLPKDCVWVPRYASDYVPIRFWVRDRSNGRKISGYFDPWSATGSVGEAFWELLSPDACDEHEGLRVAHSEQDTLSEEIERMICNLRECENCIAELSRACTDES